MISKPIYCLKQASDAHRSGDHAGVLRAEIAPCVFAWQILFKKISIPWIIRLGYSSEGFPKQQKNEFRLTMSISRKLAIRSLRRWYQSVKQAILSKMNASLRPSFLTNILVIDHYPGRGVHGWRWAPILQKQYIRMGFHLHPGYRNQFIVWNKHQTRTDLVITLVSSELKSPPAFSRDKYYFKKSQYLVLLGKSRTRTPPKY